VCIFVDPFGETGSVNANAGALREGLAWLRRGGLLATFPAGEVAHLNFRDGTTVDPPWNLAITRLARISGSSALPVFFQGSNSMAFQLAGALHPSLRTASLPRELLNKSGRQIRVRIGRPIPPARIAGVDAVQGYLAQARLPAAAGDPAREEAMLRKSVEAGPSHYRARVALAAFLLAHGNWEAAGQNAEIAVRIDGSRVDAYALLAAVHAHRGQTGDLEATLATAEKRVPDDLSPYYRAAEVLLAAGQDLERAERYLRRYLAAEPEGNTPTLSDASGKLRQILEKAKAISATRVTLGPG